MGTLPLGDPQIQPLFIQGKPDGLAAKDDKGTDLKPVEAGGGRNPVLGRYFTEVQFNLAESLQLQGRKDEAAVYLDRYRKQMAVLQRTKELLKEESRVPGKEPVAARPQEPQGPWLYRVTEGNRLSKHSSWRSRDSCNGCLLGRRRRI